MQDRDLDNLSPGPAREVRRLQRAYVEVWVALLRRVRPDLDPPAARVEVHAVLGLLNSTPHSGPSPLARDLLAAMALRALAVAPG